MDMHSVEARNNRVQVSVQPRGGRMSTIKRYRVIKSHSCVYNV